MEEVGKLDFQIAAWWKFFHVNLLSPHQERNLSPRKGKSSWYNTMLLVPDLLHKIELKSSVRFNHDQVESDVTQVY